MQFHMVRTAVIHQWYHILGQRFAVQHELSSPPAISFHRDTIKGTAIAIHHLKTRPGSRNFWL